MNTCIQQVWGLFGWVTEYHSLDRYDRQTLDRHESNFPERHVHMTYIEVTRYKNVKKRN